MRMYAEREWTDACSRHKRTGVVGAGETPVLEEGEMVVISQYAAVGHGGWH